MKENPEPGKRRKGKPRRAAPAKKGSHPASADPPPADLAVTGLFLCDLCGAPMLERHCRLICLQCGYQRDCSDP